MDMGQFGMTFSSTRELYGMFLDSDWWRRLSLRKRSEAGKCERCREVENLQSHHKFYRANWFDTVIEDLECLCRSCHEKEHKISGEVPLTEQSLRDVLSKLYNQPGNLAQARAALMSKGRRVSNRKNLNQLRSQGFISRQEFLRLKAIRNLSRKKDNQPRRRQNRRRKNWLSYPDPKHWVSRGSSSN